MKRLNRRLYRYMPVFGNKFTPLKISGLYLWLKADAITGLSDSDAVASWSDSSGNGRDVSQSDSSKRPLYKTNILNSKPGVLFDASNDCLKTASVDMSSFDKLTVFAAFTAGTGGSVRMVVEYENDGTVAGEWGLFRNSDNKVYGVHRGASTSSNFGTTSTLTTTPALVTMTYDRTLSTDELTGWYNGSAGGTRSSNNNQTGNYGAASPIYVGARNDGASLPLNGYLFELIVYTDVLDATERANVERYINSRWAIWA